MNCTVYRRSDSNWIGKHRDHSVTYWRKQVREVFRRLPQVDEVEVITTGRKTDSDLLRRGEDYPARNQYVIVASTGGKWGKSRRDYAPKEAQ